MEIFINFNGVADHLDVLDKEISRSNVLIEHVQNISCQIPEGDYELLLQVKNIMNSIDSFQENIQNRKILLLDIISKLKKENISSKNVITTIEYAISGLSDGRCF